MHSNEEAIYVPFSGSTLVMARNSYVKLFEYCAIVILGKVVGMLENIADYVM